MANITIAQLPAATAAADTDELEVNQAGLSKKVTRAQLLQGRAASGAVGSSGLTMTTARVLGRTTAATGAVEELASVPVSLGGTGATDAATARTNLGAVASGAVGSSGLTMTTARVLGRTTSGNGAPEELASLPINLGGTGATNDATARENLGLGDLATQRSNNVAITGGNLSNVSVVGTIVADSKGNVRQVPLNAQSSAYTLVVADVGKIIDITAGGVTVPPNIFSPGDVIWVFNDSDADQTIRAGSGVTIYLSGTAARGNRNLLPRGECRIRCVGSNIFTISGDVGLVEEVITAGKVLAPLSLTRAQLPEVFATALASDGVTLQQYAADTPRFNGAAQALLMERQGTDAIRNVLADGAIVGAPGVMPFYWTRYGVSGLSIDVSGTGTEAGRQYVDLRIFGTASATPAGSIVRADEVYASAAQNETWTYAQNMRIVAGSLSGFYEVRLYITTWNSSNAFLGQYWQAITPTTAALASQRYSVTATLADVGTALAGSTIFFLPLANATVDVTIRIALPSLKKFDFVDSVVLPLSLAQKTNFVVQPIATSAPTGAWVQFGATGASASITRNYSVAPNGLQEAARVRWQGSGTGTPTLRIPTNGIVSNTAQIITGWIYARNLTGVTLIGADINDGPPIYTILSQAAVGAWRQFQVSTSAGSNAAAQWLDILFSGWTTGDLDVDFWGVEVKAAPGNSTRGIDIVSAALSGLGIGSAGTILFKGTCNAPINFVPNQSIFEIDNGTTNERIIARRVGVSNDLRIFTVVSGAHNSVLVGSITPGTEFRFGISFSSSAIIASLNGAAPVSAASLPINLTHLRVGGGIAGFDTLFGEVRSLRVLTSALSSTGLQNAINAL